jgi:hypothetical protein
VSGVSCGGIILPAVIADAGEKAVKRFIEFFTATIRNGNTRQAKRCPFFTDRSIC